MDLRNSHRRFIRDLRWRTKSLLILLGALVVVLGAAVAIELWVVLPAVGRLEVAAMQRQLGQILERLQRQQAMLHDVAADTAASPLTLKIIDDPDAGSRDYPLLATLLQHRPIDLIVVCDIHGTALVARQFDRISGHTRNAPDRLVEALGRDGTPMAADSGVITGPRACVVYARLPVKSPGGGAPRGSVLIGSLVPLPQFENALIAEDVRVRIYPPFDTPPPLPHGTALPGQPVVEAINGHELVGRLTFTNSRGQPSGTIDLHAGRPLRETQIHSAKLALVAVVITLVAISTALWLIIEFAFVRRVERLTQLVGQLDEPESVDALCRFAGDDEVGRLARTTGSTAANLQRARNQAVSSDEAKSAFLRTITHELRTPMNGVIGFTTLLRDTPLSADQSEYVRLIGNSSEVLLRLIDDLLAYNSLESGRTVVSPRPTRVRDWLGGVVELVRARAVEKKLELTTEIAPDVPEILWIDPARVQQVLIHLLNNAIKFTSAGSVRVRVSAGSANPQTVRFSVTDTGIGIAPETRPTLFQPLSPGDTSMARKFGGAGMGLVICRKLVEAMGGAVGFETEPGVGSTFHFEVPAGERNAAPATSA